MKYGYVRVSSKDQNPERQLVAMKEEGIRKSNIYMDYMSGKNFDRPAYKKMLKRIKSGDILVIKSVDRLGRDYEEILEEWRIITKTIGADIEIIDMPLLNTNNVQGELTGVLLSDMILQIMAYVAETERSFIKQRQAEGIAVAKKNGVKFGASKIEMPENFEDYYINWKAGNITMREAAKELGISTSTFHRRCKDRETIVIS